MIPYLAPYLASFESKRAFHQPRVTGEATKPAIRRFAYSLGLTRSEHLRCAAIFDAIAKEHAAVYHETLDEAFMVTFDRLPNVTDYRVSCIWRDDLPETYKRILRVSAGTENLANDCARLHRTCARMRSLPE